MPKDDRNGDTPHPRLSLPPNPDEGLTPDTWQEAHRRSELHALEVHTVLGEVITEVSRLSEQSNRTMHVAHAADAKMDIVMGVINGLSAKVDANIVDVRTYRQEVVATRGSVDTMRAKLDSSSDLSEELEKFGDTKNGLERQNLDMQKRIDALTTENAEVQRRTAVLETEKMFEERMKIENEKAAKKTSDRLKLALTIMTLASGSYAFLHWAVHAI